MKRAAFTKKDTIKEIVTWSDIMSMSSFYLNLTGVRGIALIYT